MNKPRTISRIDHTTDIGHVDVAALLRYDSTSGKLFWKERPTRLFKEGTHSAEHSANIWNARYAGTEAFTAPRHGYLHGSVFKRDYPAHRICWLLHNGTWPTHEVDHINGKRDDNRIVNLRDVARYENMKNQRRNTRNTSGKMGVYLHKLSGKWLAYINVNHTRRNLGLHVKIEDAIKAREQAERLHGFHPNHGK